MPVPSQITDLNVSAAGNSPAGGESAFPTLDDYLRVLSAFIAQLREGTGLKDGAVITAKLAAGAVTEAALGAGAVSLSKLSASVQGALPPPGALMPFARQTAPSGWLAAIGSAVSVTTYPDLAAAIYCGNSNNASAAWGYKCTDPANPSTTRSTSGTYIVLPNMRDRYVKGFNSGGSRSMWAEQSSQNKAHTHSGTTSTAGAHAHSLYGDNSGSGPNGQVASLNGGSYPIGGTGRSGGYLYTSGGGVQLVTTEGAHDHSFTTASSGGTDVEVNNLAFLWCIKT